MVGFVGARVRSGLHDSGSIVVTAMSLCGGVWYNLRGGVLGS